MNISRAVTLVAILIKCVTASADAMSRFREAVDQGDMQKAVRLYRSSLKNFESLCYVVDKKDQAFIFNFAEEAEVDKGDLLAALYRKKSHEMIEEAFEVFEFDQSDLRWAASEPELMCSSDSLLNLLDKMEKQEDQEWAIDTGVGHLFRFKRTECVEPLLNALDGSESFKHFKGIAIKKAFKCGSLEGNKSIVERFYDHPAVTSKDYAVGLTASVCKSTQGPIFTFLLGEADQDDLNAVKRDPNYKYNTSYEFKKVIEDALLTAKPGGTRLTLPFQRAERVMETFRKNPNKEIRTVISQLIGYYLADESVLKPRSMLIDTVTVILESDDSGIGMVTELSDLIISYLLDELTLESITTPVKKTIGIKETHPDDSADGSA